MWTTSAHFADWYWVGARTDPDKPKHDGISLFLIPMDDPGLEMQSLPTIGKDTTNQVFFEDVFVPDDYLVGERQPGLPVHLRGARPRALHHVHRSPIWRRRSRCCVTTGEDRQRDGEPLARTRWCAPH